MQLFKTSFPRMKLTTIIFVLISSGMCLGQSVSGTIIDSLEGACPNLEVIIFNLDGEWEQGGVTDELGNYTIAVSKNGEYVLELFDRAESIRKEKVKITEETRLDIQLDRMLPKDVEGVEVVGRYKVIEREIDRIVYNVEHSVASNGLNLLEVLAMTPLILVGDNGISIVGKSGVSIMIDGKILNFGGSDLVNYLRSIRSDDVAKVEVITAPPAKYNAEGNSGMINIVLKRNPRLGWSGSLTSSYIQTTYPGVSNSGTLNYNSSKLTSTLRLRHYDRTSRATEEIDVLGATSISSFDSRKDNYNGFGGNLSLGYSLSKSVKIGLIYDLGVSNENLDIDNKTRYITGTTEDSLLLTYSQHRNSSLNHTLNLYMDITLDTIGSSLSLIGNYFSNLPDNVTNFKTFSNQLSGESAVRNTSVINYSIWSAQADYYTPMKWGEFEAGAKYVSFNNNSDVRYLNGQNDNFTVDPLRSNEFEYFEQNMAAYLSLSKELSTKWAAKAGLRYEYSTIDGYSPTTGETNSFEYSSFFPTAYVSFTPSDTHSYSLNYSKRINRPNFGALNPFRWYSNPYTYYTGNPALRPSFNHNLEFSYGYKGILNATIYGQKLINGYGRVVEVLNGSEKVVNYSNYLTKYDVGINVSLYVTPTKWWETYNSVNVGYQTSESSNPDVVPQDGYGFYYNTNNTFTLSKEKRIKGLINYWQMLPSRDGNTYSRSVGAVSVGIRFPFWKNRFQTNILVNDIFKQTVSRGDIYFADFTQQYNNYYDGRNFTVSLTYNFGNNNVQGNQKRIDFNDKYRGN